MNYLSEFDFENMTETFSMSFGLSRRDNEDEIAIFTARVPEWRAYFQKYRVKCKRAEKHVFYPATTRPAFYWFCDLLSVPFVDFCNDIGRYAFFSEQDLDVTELFERVKKYSPLLCEPDIFADLIDGCNLELQSTNGVRYANNKCSDVMFYYEIISALHMYIDAMSKHSSFRDPFVFLQFAATYYEDVKIRGAWTSPEYETSGIPLYPIKCKREKDAMLKKFAKAVQSSSAKQETSVLLHGQSLKEYLVNTFFLILQRRYTVKRCKNCGRYFVSFTRSDALYCDRESPQEPTKTCKEYGGAKKHSDNLKTNEAMNLYRKVYQAKQILVKRHAKDPDPVLYNAYKTSFEKYVSQSKQWKADVKSGKRQESEYIEWLKAVKGKKVL